MALIPREALWLIWLVAMLVSAAASFLSCRTGNRSMGVALAGFALGAASMLSFYTMLLYVPFNGSTEISVAWSRWAIGVNGLTILLGSLSALIASVRSTNGTNDA